MSRLIDLDNEDLAPSQGGGARISTPGIHTNVKFLGVTLVDKPADPAKGKKGYVAAEFLFENQQGEQHKELYMQPAQSVEDVKFTSDKYDKIDGKMVKTRKMTKEEMLQVVNNDFIHFLIDLGNALGYPAENVKTTMKKAVDFKTAVEVFKKYFPAGKATINVRILYQNSKPYQKQDGTWAKGSSWLKIKNSGFPMYYPYEADLFEAYHEGRPSSLFISKYDYEHNMVEKYPYVKPEGPATDNPIAQQQAAPIGTSAAAPAIGGGNEPDPF